MSVCLSPKALLFSSSSTALGVVNSRRRASDASERAESSEWVPPITASGGHALRLPVEDEKPSTTLHHFFTTDHLLFSSSCFITYISTKEESL